jgi:signal transduction histidine kinase
MGILWVDKILGSDERFSFEDRTLNAILFSSAVFAFISAVSDIILYPGPLFSLLSISVCIIMTALYVTGRKCPKYRNLVVPYVLTFSAGMLALWHIAGGITGPVPMYFIVLLFIIPIFIYGKKRYYVLAGSVAYYLSIFIYEMYQPESVIPYQSTQLARIDHFTSSLYLAMMAFAVMSLVVYSYEQKKQKAEDLNKSKDRLISIIAHDLRGPMSSLNQLGRMLLDQHNELDADYRREFISHIANCSNETHNLLENLLKWAQAENNEIEVKPETINLISCIDESSKVLMESLRQKRIKLNVDVPHDHVVYADQNMLMTVIRNILSNAIKFTENGGSILVKSSMMDEGNVQLEVTDTGMGIAKDQQQKLFDYKITSPTKGTNSELGSGLGLNLCKDFIVKNKGDIKFTSELNKGTTFLISLPASQK